MKCRGRITLICAYPFELENRFPMTTEASYCTQPCISRNTSGMHLACNTNAACICCRNEFHANQHSTTLSMACMSR